MTLSFRGQSATRNLMDKIMKKVIIVCLIISLFLSIKSLAQDVINEDELFSTPESIFETGKIIDNTFLEEEKKDLGISGEATSVIAYTHRRTENIEKENIDQEVINDDKDTTLSTYIVGNVFFDARLKKGIKCFADTEIQYNSSTNDEDFTLREFFLDFNVKNSVYFRTGKQVLQWGRCFLWNPSDLINVEKKTFQEKIGSREGAYGMKVHIPFGTRFNIYGFLDTGNVRTSDEIGVAGKFEFIVGGTEMAFSAWNKKGYRPVFAYDFSTGIFGIDIIGEEAFSYGDNYEKLKIENGVLTTYKEENKWIPRVSINLGKSFDCMEIHDRISINLEFYYNEAGYTDNVLSDPKTYPFSKPLIIPDTSAPSANPQEITKRDFLLYNSLDEPYNFSKYYVALFTTTRKFILSDMNLILNMIENLNDESFILTTGVHYTNINDFSIGLSLYSFFGKKNGEFTIHNNTHTVQLTFGIVF